MPNSRHHTLRTNPLETWAREFFDTYAYTRARGHSAEHVGGALLGATKANGPAEADLSTATNYKP